MTTPPPATEPPATPPPETPQKPAEQDGDRGGHRSFGDILRLAIEENTVTITVLALVTATVIGGLLTAFTNTTVLTAWGNFFSAPGNAIGAAWDAAFGTYWALFEGSVFNPHTVAALFQQASFSAAIHDGFLSAVFNPLSETAVQATPLILTGLALGPGVDATVPWLTVVFGGRQFARLWHFTLMVLLFGYFGTHLALVVSTGFWNNMRSMITGWYQLKEGDGVGP